MRANTRRGPVAAFAIITALILLVAAACSSKSSTTSSGGTTTTTNAHALGTPNKATGTPIKIGFVNDGKTDAVDQTASNATFNATVTYVNDYLGGINGHVIKVDACETLDTPSGGTTCAVQMANDKVAAVLVPASAQDTSVYTGLKGSGIPYFTYTAASSDIILQPGAFLLTNPIAAIAAPAKEANDKGYKKAAIIVIDVPAATGPITAIAKPIFTKAGVDLNVVPISAQTADMTPQIQQAISGGAQLFAITGTDDFVANAVKTLKQLGFNGTITIGAAPSKAMVQSVPGGFAGVVVNTSNTANPNDRDVQLYNAIISTYQKTVTPNSFSPDSFATVLAFQRALEGVTNAVDASTISAALSGMPKALDLPLGGGITYRCGSKPVSFAPNICAANILKLTLNAQGQTSSSSVLDVSQYMTLG